MVTFPSSGFDEWEAGYDAYQQGKTPTPSSSSEFLQGWKAAQTSKWGKSDLTITNVERGTRKE